MKHQTQFKLVIALTVILLLQTFSVCAQCSIQTTSKNNVPITVANFEKLFSWEGINDNGDLSEGFQIVYIRLYAIGESKHSWFLEINSRCRKLTEVKPRSIGIKLLNDDILTLDARDVYYFNGMEIFRYALDGQALEFIKQPIAVFEIVDNRTEESITIEPIPYDRLLVDQYRCIMSH